MDILALCISILSLIISCVAYYRSGGKQEISAHEQTLNQNIERLTAMAQGADDDVAARRKARYERNLRTIAALRSRVAALKEEAVEEIREDVGRIAQILDRLAERAARELRNIKAGIDATLTQADIGLRLTIDDAKAHLKVIEAKRELVLARIAIARNDFVDAEARVESALRYLEEAQSLAVGHQEGLAALRSQAQQMLVAIRTKADTMRASIDALLDRSNRLLNQMSGHGAAAKTAA
jgi:hypothetical protein